LNLGRWFRTIRDIPPGQLAARVQYEIKARSLPRLPRPLRRSLALGHPIPTPPLRQGYLRALELPEVPNPIPPPQASYTLTFLNQSRKLNFPITWNSPEYPRLWQFNLHYFDWVREVLAAAYQQGQIDGESLSQVKHFISDWINANSLYSFDGWHPYTTSLRIVNWTYVTRAIPRLAEPEILASVWHQIQYLHRSQEYFAGGNHLLENLRALIIGGLNFNHPNAEKIVHIALHQLAQQLTIQVLPDGGHYELSPMYHLIVVNLVAESVACLRSAGGSVPETVNEALHRMLQFSQNLRLFNGTYPLWNDAAYNVINPLDEVVSWVSQLLGQPPTHPTDALHNRLLGAAGISPMQPFPKPSLTTSSSFPDSGYYILRNSSGLELAFDCAPPCPKELPPHAHADCLTVDLYFNGQPLIVDTGTSQYGGGAIRAYERSTLAHNTIAIANRDQSEVWGSFRVGRKAQPFNVRSGTFEGWQWVSAAHDGYTHPPLNAVHQRWVGLGNQELVILDHLKTTRPTEYTSTLHIAPGLSLVYHPDIDEYSCQLKAGHFYIKVLGLGRDDRVKWMDSDTSQSWYAPEFGQRYPRGLLQIQGLLPPQGKTICTVLTLNSRPDVAWEGCDRQGKLQFDNRLVLKWHFEQGTLVI
jgi:uncharacterized heparinase superfamily protein